jgi:hypothetical protein
MFNGKYRETIPGECKYSRSAISYRTSVADISGLCIIIASG